MTFEQLFEICIEKVQPRTELFDRFFHELCIYQSNHYGGYDPDELYLAYQSLPPDFKKIMTASRKQLSNCFRGDDGKNIKNVLSFTWNADSQKARNNAGFYGRYVYSLASDFSFYEASLDTGKFEKYFGKKNWSKITEDFPIGDDENEILIFGAKFKVDIAVN